MSNFTRIITICQSASGAGSKQVIKDALAELDSTGQTLIKYAMDPFLVYGVKKFDMPTSFAKSMDEQQDFSLFFALLDSLAAKELTGNSARDAITATLSRFNEQTQKYLALVIDKDLQAGFSAETYNKVHKNNQVYIFDVQLADKCSEVEEFEQYITFPCQADVKYDGERNICLVSDTIEYRSRSGKMAEHMFGLFDEELQRIRAHLGYDFVLDGERMAANYIETINAKKSGEEGELGKKNMKFRAFFLMPLTDWKAKKTTITTRQNREFLTELLAELKCEKIILSEGREVKDYVDMVAYTDEVTTPGFDGMEKGQEGLILKDWNSTYEWDRTMAWCKVKKFFDFEGKILNFELGRKSNANRMGRVNVYGTLEDGTEFVVGVGSGWSIKDRDDCVANFETKWKGQIMQGRYQEVSKGKNKQYYSLRFPTAEAARGFRDDKVINVPDDVTSMFPSK